MLRQEQLTRSSAALLSDKTGFGSLGRRDNGIFNKAPEGQA